MVGTCASPLAGLCPRLVGNLIECCPCAVPGRFGAISCTASRECVVCGVPVDASGGSRCWVCGKWFHAGCLGRTGPARGPFACPACEEASRAKGIRDVGLDSNLMLAVTKREVPGWWHPMEARRCTKAARWLAWKRGHLWIDDE